MNNPLLLALLLGLSASPMGANAQPPVDQLAQRVLRGSGHAFLEAANTGRQDLVPTIEDYIRTTHNSPSSANYAAAQMALAKLGVKKYRDEIIREVLNPRSTEVYRYRLKMMIESRQDPAQAAIWAEWEVRGQAFVEKLPYLDDPRTVKLVASFLDDMRRPPLGGGPPAAGAVYVLPQMTLIDPPVPKGTVQMFTKENYEKWQAWWAQHKDYYEKLEFETPLSEILHPFIPSNTPPAAVSSATVQESVPVPTAAETQPVSAASKPLAYSWRWVVIGGLVILMAIGLSVACHCTKHR